MIKYLGSKRTLVPVILGIVERLAGVSSVVDLFSGTSRVGRALKAAGYRVLSNDHNAYAETLARCYVQADRSCWHADAERLVSELNRVPGRPGYVTETFCERARYFHPKNGERIDAIREEIARLSVEPELEAVLLTALLEAADRVDSTTGVQMAYLKTLPPRAHNELRLRVPEMVDRPAAGVCEAHRMDAVRAAGELEADCVYLDPPYNQHSYLGNYHVWESLVLWDKPEVYGVACKRADCRERRSAFNSRRQFAAALGRVLGGLRCRHVVLSFSNEGYLSREALETMLGSCFEGRGTVTVVEQDYRRYVGAQIGIHNPAGERVGRVSHLTNKELLYVVSDPETAGRSGSLRRSCVAHPTPQA